MKGGEILTSTIHRKYYKIKLHNLSETQKDFVKRTADAYRYCYNLGVEWCNKAYEEKKAGKKSPRPSYFTMASMLTQYIKREENAWLRRVEYTTCRYALKDVNNAFERFFKHQCGYPKFHSKRKSKVSFHVRDDRLRFCDVNGGNTSKEYVRIPGTGKNSSMLFSVKNHNIPVGENVKYDNVRISFDGIDYWLSLSVRVIYPIVYEGYTEAIGIDVGVRTAATLSDGTVFEGPNRHRLNVLESRRRKLQSVIQKDINKRLEISTHTRTKYDDIPKSKNQIKREKRLLKTYHKIHNMHDTYYHQISRDIANRRAKLVVIEDLKVRRMIHNSPKGLSKLEHSAMKTLLTYIEYKCNEVGSTVIKASSFFPSSQICSRCGNRYKVGKPKIYHCPSCGLEIDRDLNAAINLRNYGLARS